MLVAIAWIVHVHARGHLRWGALVLALLVAALVAAARVSRGVQYPTELLVTARPAVGWLASTYRVALRPGDDERDLGAGWRDGF